jgi:DNA-binding transcriptional LysR family regulator
MLPMLGEAHPGITIHLYFGSGPDLELRTRTQEIDCAISSRRITDPKVDGIRLHREDYVFVASPALLDRNPFESVADARNHVVIDTSIELALFRYWRDAPGGDDTIRFAAERYMGTIAAIRSAVVDQLGVAVLPEYLIRGDLKRGRLIPLLPEVEPVHDFFRLIHRKDDPRISLLRAIAKTMRSRPLR